MHTSQWLYIALMSVVVLTMTLLHGGKSLGARLSV